MKNLYKILRLFFCPHKYKTVISSGTISSYSKRLGVSVIIGNYWNKECSRCGDIKRFESVSQ